MKQCKKCGVLKENNFFVKDENMKDGFRNSCKECKNLGSRKYRITNREHVKELQKKVYFKHREKNLEKKKAVYYANRDKDNARRREHYKNNKKNHLERCRLYTKNREQKDINFKLSRRLRHRLYLSIKNSQKAGSAVADLGCSVQHLKLHLELFFDEGMSWENYGFGDNKWHIDHIKPLSSFDLTNREQFLEACHYTNLQPMWQKDNFEKAASIIN